MTKFTKTIYRAVLFLKLGGNHFKRYITYANYEFLFQKMLSVFEIFVNKFV